jgi:nicotinamide mononucleotide transporter
MSGLEIVAVILSALAVWLTARRHLWCWPIGLVSVLLYARIFLVAKLYSDLLLQLIFAVMQLYGWWQWKSAASDQDSQHIQPQRLPKQGLLSGLLAGAAGSVVLGYVMASFTDAHIPWLDSALTSFSLVAQFWMARKYVANWWLWIAVDIIYVGVYIYKDLNLTAGLYAGFIVLAVVGLRNWQRQLPGNHPPAAAASL